MVEIFVGPEEQLFRVYKKVLCDKIDYFDKMFNGGFKEATEGKATLPEDKPESFDLLLGWVYHGTIRPLTFTRKETRSRYSWCPIKFYILAEKFCLSNLQDRIMSAMMETDNTGNTLKAGCHASLVYQGTYPNSPLRKYAIQGMAYLLLNEPNCPTSAFLTSLENKDLARDFLESLRGQSSKQVPDPRYLPKCDFHCHEKGADCPDKA